MYIQQTIFYCRILVIVVVFTIVEAYFSTIAHHMTCKFVASEYFKKSKGKVPKNPKIG